MQEEACFRLLFKGREADLRRMVRTFAYMIEVPWDDQRPLEDAWQDVIERYCRVYETEVTVLRLSRLVQAADRALHAG